MLVIPAIDLRGGRCVRLFQGDFNRETSYSDDPNDVARRWEHLGARRLHVVDLDGARAGTPRQLDLIQEICRAVDVPVQIGGGLRSRDHVRAALAAGVDRVILGTAAVEDPSLLKASVEEFGPERVVLGVDARDGKVAVRGWEEVSEIVAADVIANATSVGIARVVYTDIDRDGTLTSPNFDETERIATIGPAVIASGGVSRWEDLERLATIANVEATIVGRALYDGTIVVDAAEQWIIGEDTFETGAADEHA